MIPSVGLKGKFNMYKKEGERKDDHIKKDKLHLNLNYMHFENLDNCNCKEFSYLGRCGWGSGKTFNWLVLLWSLAFFDQLLSWVLLK